MTLTAATVLTRAALVTDVTDRTLATARTWLNDLDKTDARTGFARHAVVMRFRDLGVPSVRIADDLGVGKTQISKMAASWKHWQAFGLANDAAADAYVLADHRREDGRKERVTPLFSLFTNADHGIRDLKADSPEAEAFAAACADGKVPALLDYVNAFRAGAFAPQDEAADEADDAGDEGEETPDEAPTDAPMGPLAHLFAAHDALAAGARLSADEHAAATQVLADMRDMLAGHFATAAA